MQWVPNVSYSILQGLPRVSAVQVSDSVLWHSQSVHPLSPPSSSFPLCTPGTTRALCTLCHAGRNSSCTVPVAWVVRWMGQLLPHPLEFDNQEPLNLEL